jgi:hypothetical protein
VDDQQLGSGEGGSGARSRYRSLCPGSGPELARRATSRFSCAAGSEHGALYEKAQRKRVPNLDEAATLVDSTEFDGRVAEHLGHSS